MIDGLGHADTGILADIDFVEHLLGTSAREGKGADDGSQEAERDGDDARVFQREERLSRPIMEVPSLLVS